MSDPAWRIDSLDARAGLAFASWRKEDLSAETPDADRPAIFLSPPSFRPEALASRAIGLSATRAAAQLGVFVDELELAFETLEALTEFVRRAYVSSGGGDGESGASPRPPPEPEGGPEIGEGPEGEEPSPGARAVVAQAEHASLLAAELVLRPGRPMPTATFSPKAWKASEKDGGSLRDGATALLVEFLRRYPLNGHGDHLMRWSEGAQRLGVAVGALGLWPEIIDGRMDAVLDQCAYQIAGRMRPGPFPQDRRLIPMLFEPLGSAWSWMRPAMVEEMIYFAGRYGAPIGWGAARGVKATRWTISAPGRCHATSQNLPG